jgi:hypothetical protein
MASEVQLGLSKDFPSGPADRSYVCELIADGWMTKGIRKMTIFYVRREIETDPTNENTQHKLDELKVGCR